MPESKKRKKVEERRIAASRQQQERPAPQLQRSPQWWAPVMVALAVIGLIVVVTAYVSHGQAPIPGFGNGNLFVGIGLMMVGFLMTMGWK
ncbi:cell division protein CrgA [Arcanobacterium pinnipediorum]|uniref:Cell division protein CrgA n=1 Tax=Arcanobacterium pinnipediorum TaxID=1503041 RepID=A0ABY5AHB3_9ACTO|nr:cell division protein CrgA [Arcanobacterium pinnipediorum]USR79477.1 cell division protein CrgA [Arcanobacterium pinnipediorum]